MPSPRSSHHRRPAKKLDAACVLARFQLRPRSEVLFFWLPGCLRIQKRQGAQTHRGRGRRYKSSRPRSLSYLVPHPELREDCPRSLRQAGTEVEYFETPMDNFHCGGTLAVTRGDYVCWVGNLSIYGPPRNISIDARIRDSGWQRRCGVPRPKLAIGFRAERLNARSRGSIELPSSSALKANVPPTSQSFERDPRVTARWRRRHPFHRVPINRRTPERNPRNDNHRPRALGARQEQASC